MLKSDALTLSLELGREGKFAVKSTSWTENKVFLPGDQLRLEVVLGRWVLTHWHSEAKAKEAARRVGLPAAAGGLGAAMAHATASQR